MCTVRGVGIGMCVMFGVSSGHMCALSEELVYNGTVRAALRALPSV